MKKIIFIVIDGLADDCLDSEGRTPVEAANGVVLHHISKLSEPVLIKTLYRFLPIGSIVANMGLLGYNPYEYFPFGRSFFELSAKRDPESLSDSDLILRCNTISLDKGIISDFTAGQVDDDLARKFINLINKKLPRGYHIEHGKNYRNSLVIKDSILKPDDLICFEPHTRIGEKFKKLLIMHSAKSINSEKTRAIKQLNKIMLESIKTADNFNKDFGSKINMIWLWEPSSKASLYDFGQYYQFKLPFLITGSDFLNGIAKCAGIPFEINEKYTGESNTDYKGKGQSALKKLREGADFLYVHINATDEEAHQRKFDNKKKAIELTDKYIVKPIFDFIRESNDEYVMIIGGDHYTSSSSGNHLDLPSPMIIYRNKSEKEGRLCDGYSEKSIIANSETMIYSYNLIRFVL